MGLEGAQDAISEVNAPQGSFCRQQQCKDCQSCRLSIRAATDKLLPGAHTILRTAGQQRLGHSRGCPEESGSRVAHLCGHDYMAVISGIIRAEQTPDGAPGWSRPRVSAARQV